MEKLYNKETSSFIYNNIANKNSNPRYDIKQFWLKQNIAIKFSTHIINFRSITQ